MKIQYYETCNSQYHAGHHLPVVQVMVDGSTTYKDVQEALKEENTTGHLEYQYFKHESYWDAYQKAVDEWFATRGTPLDTLWSTSLEVPEDEDEEWDVYAFFVIEEVNDHMVERVRKNPDTCPYCDSTDLKSTHEELTRSVTCDNCGESWKEIYELAEVEFDNDNN